MEIPEDLVAELETSAFDLVGLSGVTGIGLGLREESEEFFDELAIRILVDDANDLPAGLPDQLAGLPVCVIEFPVEPLFGSDLTRYDSLIGGCQIEQAPKAAGTLGAVVLDSSGDLVGLTCHHVSGDPGTPVYQPTAPFIPVGTTPDMTDCLGTVLAFDSPIAQTIPVPTGTGLWLGRQVDAATISLSEAATQGRSFANEIADGFGAVDSTAAPVVQDFVRKRGSQTGPTGGQIVARTLAMKWRHGQPPPGHGYAMTSQYEIFFSPPDCPDGIFSRGGDSGSVVLKTGTQIAVGLLWGGIRDGGHRAMMSDITLIEQQLGLTIAWAFQ